MTAQAQAQQHQQQAAQQQAQPYQLEADDPYAADGEDAATGGAAPHGRRWHSLRSREDRSLRRRPTTKQPTASEMPGLPHDATSSKHARGILTTTAADSDSPLCHDTFASSDRPSNRSPVSPSEASSPSSRSRWPNLALTTAIQTHPSAASSRSTPVSSSFSAPTSPIYSPLRKTSSNTSSTFPGLSSHPPLPDDFPPSPRSVRPFPSINELDYETDDYRHPATGVQHYVPYHNLPPHSRPTSPPSRSSSRRAAEDFPRMAVENFSRPRKPSVTRPNVQVQGLPSSVRPPLGHPQDESPIIPPHLSAWPRTRGPSVSSSKSTATFSSVPTRPSNDHLNSSYRTAPRTTAATATTTTTLTLSGSTPNGAIISPGLPRPQMAYTRVDSNGSPKKQPGPFPHHARDPAPWIADEETRSSYRSHLTTSTTQNTIFSAATERSSIGTSRTSSSTHGFGQEADDGGLSLEDVMGMYEKGFADSTGAEDNDYDSPRKGGGARNRSRSRSTGNSQRSRASSRSKYENRNVGNQIMEAMSDSLPMPPRVLGLAAPGPLYVRDSAAFFRNSGLDPVQPHAPVAEAISQPLRDEVRRHKPSDSTSSRHDSAKLVDADDNSIIGRNVSMKSVRTHRSTPSLTMPSRPSISSPDLATVRSNDEPATPEAQAPPPQPASIPQQQQLYSAPEEDDESARDRYGFRKHNQYISREQYDAWDTSYSAYLSRRKKKWTTYLKDSGLIAENPDRFPPRTAKTKRFIRKGIPPEWRGAAWFYYAGGPSILAKHSGVYEDLVRRSRRRGEAKVVDVEAIERDLHRTFPDNASFRFAKGDEAEESAGGEPPIITSLRRVLLAFAIYNPQIGYCQSLNFLAGLLLLFVETEEQAFWLLNVITILHLPGTHEMSLEGSKVDLGVLMGAVQDSMPGVWAKVGSELDDGGRPPTQGAGSVRAGKKSSRKGGKSATVGGGAAGDRLPPITLCMTAWFMSCFIGTLPIETTLRVWDVFFYEGSRTLFRVALGIFKLGESEIRAVQDPMEMFGVVQALPRRLLDCNMVMEATFRRRNGFGHLSQEAIDERRNERREALKDAARIGADGAATDADGVPEMRRKNTLFGRRR